MTDHTLILKKINGKLAWVCLFLIIIAVNTCRPAVTLTHEVSEPTVAASTAGKGLQ